jgi:hypothetical protein
MRLFGFLVQSMRCIKHLLKEQIQVFLPKTFLHFLFEPCKLDDQYEHMYIQACILFYFSEPPVISYFGRFACYAPIIDYLTNCIALLV